jgi:uncharacterized membrane protein YdjX (TVP38/TMEM64 family)
MTLIGFTWGLWPGFLIASISSLLGAAVAFLSVRVSCHVFHVWAVADAQRFFLHYVKKRSNDKWDAFGRVMREKGLPLVIMIRYCPVPWALSNGLFAVSLPSSARHMLTPVRRERQVLAIHAR